MWNITDWPNTLTLPYMWVSNHWKTWTCSSRFQHDIAWPVKDHGQNSRSWVCSESLMATWNPLQNKQTKKTSTKLNWKLNQHTIDNSTLEPHNMAGNYSHTTAQLIML